MGFFDWLNRFSAAVKPGGDLIDLLKQTKKLNGTELRITPGVVPQAIVKGRFLSLSEFTLGAEECRKMCYVLFTDARKAEFEKNKKIEFVFGIKKIGRFKANIVSAEGKVNGTFTMFDQP
jgi:twitching motility protein PilT